MKSLARPRRDWNIVHHRSSWACPRNVSAMAEQTEARVPAVTYKPKVREVAPPPEETPVIHSTAYLVKGKARTFDFQEDTPSDLEAIPDKEAKVKEEFTGNALEWALHKADQQLNQAESGSGGASKAAMDVVKSPAGQVTLRAFQGFATVAAAAGPQILKVAAPVGKQLLKLGAQGVVSGVEALDSAKKKSKAAKTTPKPSEKEDAERS